MQPEPEHVTVIPDEPPGPAMQSLADEELDMGFDHEAWRAEPHKVGESAPTDEATRASLDLGNLVDIDPQEAQSSTGNRTLLDDDQAFIDALQGASLDDENLHPDVLERLRNPLTDEYQLDDPALHLSLEVFLGLDRASEAHYNLMQGAVLRSHGISMLSLHQVKRAVQDISGVRAVYDDMCLNSCVAYTGPYTNHQICPVCSEQRYDQLKLAEKGTKVPCQRMLTNVIGPQLQAMWRTPAGARAMKYRDDCTKKMMADAKLTANGKSIDIPVYSDYIHGTEYIAAVACGDVQDTNTVLMLSIDGAQLYRSKQSDCWIYIWVNYNRAPDN